ncbi:MAG: hypothetical protein JWR26_3206 [Pedosphaera sp.]|nr:hypothetical protein [Pedosphaera sp.]
MAAPSNWRRTNKCRKWAISSEKGCLSFGFHRLPPGFGGILFFHGSWRFGVCTRPLWGISRIGEDRETRFASSFASSYGGQAPRCAKSNLSLPIWGGVLHRSASPSIGVHRSASPFSGVLFLVVLADGHHGDTTKRGELGLDWAKGSRISTAWHRLPPLGREFFNSFIFCRRFGLHSNDESLLSVPTAR